VDVQNESQVASRSRVLEPLLPDVMSEGMREARHAARILVVDDEPQVVWVLRLGLESEGYVTYAAHDGVEALERIAERRPDAMVLDVMMPRMDGWTVLERLLELPPERRPRVVMVTALASREDRRRAVELGADAYVPKPFDVDELIDVLHGLELAS
jgi:CheY-like chemotaxis protein